MIDSVVQAQVVPLDPTAPFRVLGWGAENAEEIPLGIAGGALALLEVEEDVFEAHDGGGLFVAAGAGAGGDELTSQSLLLVRHLLQTEPLACRFAVFVLEGNEVPVGPLLVVELKDRLGFLLRFEAGDEALAGAGQAQARRLGLLAEKRRPGQARQQDRHQHPLAQHQTPPSNRPRLPSLGPHAERGEQGGKAEEVGDEARTARERRRTVALALRAQEICDGRETSRWQQEIDPVRVWWESTRHASERAGLQVAKVCV